MTNTHLLNRLVANPARTVMLGFAVVIALGTLALWTPLAAESGESTDFLTALFTATSATCVTGLVTVDTATHWSTFGEVTILALIQIGGLGVMSAATLLVMVIGRRLGAPVNVLTSAESRSISHRTPGEVVLGIVWFTLAVEVATTVVLSVRLRVAYHDGWAEALYSGFFHAISAFNNAGFALQADSAVPWVEDPWMCLPIMASVMIGGLGFPVWWEVLRHWRQQFRRWTTHARIVLWGSLVLWIGGAVTLAAFEWRNEETLGPLGTGGKILAAAFQSVVARTAGFNSIDIGALHQESLLLLDTLMFIGGGNAGTAGGIKVSTFALLGFVIWAELRGEPSVRVLHRRLSADNMRQALTVVLLGVGLVGGSTAALLVATPFELDTVLFEAISAFGTVGMSTGITGKLPPVGELVIIALMFLGRLGPITLGAALALRHRPRRFEVPQERVLVG
ncbi:TrkH family potassium uptake protein [Janibacter cremeus]|uniref:Potassium uptake TrkH family protein n=1 Tax=Janibacter cremeus TaxID=1285192 RepID=A0A852VW71_9MICO|nr:potassium uptake TrkH family protein [Janibacter cremeus]